MNLSEYLKTIKDRKIVVIGMGISNTPLIKLLLTSGARVTVCDKKQRSELDGLAEELEALGAGLKLGEDYLENIDGDLIFRTPGMHPEEPHLAALRERGAEVTSEMEVFFRLCPCKIIAVTGSDGKTTTTTIISEILKKSGKTVFIGGNIGKPLLPEVDSMKSDDVAVVELSSFQLMTMTSSPEVAVVTNLSPNHLDIHKSMEEYVNAKKNIFLHQSPVGKLVLNLDNAITKGFASEAVGEVSWFSRQEKPDKGVYLKDGIITDCEDGSAILDSRDIIILGVHNIENYMAAIEALRGMVSREDIEYVAKTFTGVEHRIELVRIKDGVKYYNDSMSSSPTRTIAGLNSFHQKVILIAGGYDKHISYDVLGPAILKSVKTLVLTGATAGKINEAVKNAPGYAEGQPEILLEEDFTRAVTAAAGLAQPGDVVILSPASASFDKFKNYAHRGNTFKSIVNSL